MIDLSNCAQEPIHIPGKIQPFGALIAFSRPDLVAVSVSEGLEKWLGIPARNILGKRLAEWIPSPESRRLIEARLSSPRLGQENPTTLAFQVGGEERLFDAIFNRSGEFAILELEAGEAHRFADIYGRIQSGVRAIEYAENLEQLFNVTARWVHELTGYYRVMIYQFDADWNGRVIAEAKSPEAEPFLGLRYPASDIPAQARALYQFNPVRIIADVGYVPEGLLTLLKEPLDLSYSVLRSVSPVHIQYLKNMGVGASMSVSLLREGKLWGIIACHHDEARPLSYEVRQGLEFVARFFALQLLAKERNENAAYKNRLRDRQARLHERMRSATGLFLRGLEPSLLEMADGATGAAIAYHGEIYPIGATPSREQLDALVGWLRKNVGNRPVFESSQLKKEYPEAEAFAALGSGLMCVSIPEPEPGYVMWFKPEVIRTVDWAGDPRKPAEPDGTLSPRQSFAIWKETVRHTSLPWASEELESAELLRRSIVEVDLERQVLAALRSNEELDQFAHVISHDLKEPLRGIQAFAGFVQKDAAAVLDQASLDNLQLVRDLSEKSRALLTDLYEYSKLGKIEFVKRDTRVQEILDSALARMQGLIQQRGVEIRVPRPLPHAECDPVRLGEVLANLIGNAIKYNDERNKWVEIGYADDPRRFYVRDNGIGIAPADQERVFKIFQRLHAPEEYGGGTGSGLAIASRMIQRQGGRLWVESAPGRGSTFWFTL